MVRGRGARCRPRRTDLRGSSVSLRAITSLALGLGVLFALDAGDAVAAGAPAPLLELFVHPAHGGGWSARPIDVRLAGTAAPSVAAGRGLLALGGVGPTGDVSVSVGTLSGTFTTADLGAVAGAPPAAGRPAVWVSAQGLVEVWYRTATGDLEVATRTIGGAWSALDVTAVVHAPSLAGDPAVIASGPTTATAYAVASAGEVVSFADPAGTPTGWSATTQTSGSAAPALSGTVDVLAAPGAPGATVLLGTTATGDVVEESDEVAGPPAGVGKWRAIDLTATGHVPAAAGGLAPTTPSQPEVAYRTWSGDVVALTLSTGLPGGTVATDLASTWATYPAQGAVPTLAVGPLGPLVAIRSITGDLVLMSVGAAPAVVDASFQPHTGVLVGSDVAATVDGGADVLVAASAGPIAPTALTRRIVLLATSFDQDHAGFQTTPAGSDCNPFTATFGRGSSAGCPPGDAAEAWCSDFAEWVWQTSGVPTRTMDGWSASFITWGRLHHRVQLGTSFTPEVGDAIVWGTRTPLYGTHVALIVSVQGGDVSIVSGNSGGDEPGYGVGVWRSGPFDAATSTVNGYPVVGVVRP